MKSVVGTPTESSEGQRHERNPRCIVSVSNEGPLQSFTNTKQQEPLVSHSTAVIYVKEMVP